MVERIAIPTAPPICCDVLMSPRRETGLLRLRAGDGRDGHGDVPEGESEPNEEKAREERSVQYEPEAETCVK